ncbi:MAG: type IV toxin-antitoxin system AbiEi family antitoxin domain-containing protein [Lentisphaerota bacterium]
MGTSSKAIRLDLEAISSMQGGFFTTKQAVNAGYNDSVHPYHLRNGDWIRSYRGIYRLSSMEPPEWPELIIYSLWSRDRNDMPQGIYSHETALMIHGLIPRTDRVLDMTVHKLFRKNCTIPKILKLYKNTMAESDWETRAGFRVATIERTFSDLEGTSNPQLLEIISQHSSSASTRSFNDMLNMGFD